VERRRQRQMCIRDRPQTQIDHVVISHRWRGSVTDCRSFWNTCVDTDHALVRCSFSLCFSGQRKLRMPRLATEKLKNPNTKQLYQDRLLQTLPTVQCPDINSHWKTISTALLEAGEASCGRIQTLSSKHWISDKTVALLDSRKRIPYGREHNALRRTIRRQVKLSIRADREAWWAKIAEEMEKARNAGNFQQDLENPLSVKQ
jgi:hypothetical protein